LGVALARQSHWAEAEEHFRAATTNKPEWATAWYRLSAALAKQNKSDEAKKAFQRATYDAKNDDPEIRARRAAHLRRSGQLDPALEEINASIQSSVSPTAGMFYIRGRILSDLGHHRESIEAHRMALKLDKDMEGAHFGLALALQDAGQTSDAEKSFREAIRLRADFKEAHAFLGTLLAETNRFDQAEAELRKAISLCPNHPEYHSYLGQFLIRRRRLCDAYDEFSKSLDCGHNIAWVGLGTTLRLQGKIDKAIIANLKAIHFNPRLASAYYGLGMCYASQNKYQDAAGVLFKAVEYDPKLSAPHFYLGKVLIALGKAKESRDALTEALKTGYSKWKVFFQMARAFALEGNDNLAVDYFSKAIKAGYKHHLNRLSNDQILLRIQHLLPRTGERDLKQQEGHSYSSGNDRNDGGDEG
jgi:superkiller protein 3